MLRSLGKEKSCGNSVFISFHEYILLKSSCSIWSLKSSIYIQILKTDSAGVDSARSTLYEKYLIKQIVLKLMLLEFRSLFAIENLTQTLYLGGKHIFLSPEIGFFIQKEYWSGSYFTSRLVPALHVLQQKERELSVSLLLTRTLGDKQPKILVFGHLKSTHNLTWHCP